ncbi:MAG TPA: HDOD domain-containing protein [Verrucomicrobiae bacterium]|nr:HDOD domain-containing protein [Verrucomicrobiae bacterium]
MDNTGEQMAVIRSLDDYIAQAQDLVPAPQVLPQILPLLHQPEVDTHTVVDLIAYNQTLTANVLRLCNSAYFAPKTRIDSLHAAVTLVGFRQIHDIVISVISAAALAHPQTGYGVEADDLWGHSVATALATQIVARDCSADQQTAFTAGILHDIGKIVLSVALEDAKDKVAQMAAQESLTPYEIEMKLLGVNHAEAGGRLLERWNLPENLTAAVRYHHHPAGAQGNEQLAACVFMGNFIAYLMGYGYGKYSLDLRAREEALGILSVTPEKIMEFKEEGLRNLVHVKSLYNLKQVPSRP